MPYALASLWDTHYAERHSRAITAIAEEKARRRLRPDDVDGSLNAMCKEVRRKIKYGRAATGLLKDLEEDIRAFIQGWRAAEYGVEYSKINGLSGTSHDSENDDLSVSDGESVVFRGRGGLCDTERPLQAPPSPATPEPPSPSDVKPTFDGLPMPEKMIFQARADESAASFG